MGIKQETDILGYVYGRLTVESFSYKEKLSKAGYEYYFNCKCKCGNNKKIKRSSLKNKRVNSCGCLHTEQLIERNENNRKYDIGLDNQFNKLYGSWKAMHDRCNNPLHVRYSRYGGRGIKIFEDWNNWNSFRDWAIDNGWKDGLTIERLDFNGNYEPTNCTWATYKEQANNTSTNKYIKYKGETKTLSRWCEELDLKYDRIKARINTCHWSVEDAFEKEKYATQKGL